MLRFLPIRYLIGLLIAGLGVILYNLPVYAANVDDYVVRYLQAREPVPLMINSQGETRLFSPEELTAGKHLFEENCKNCHVGGATLPNPMESLSMQDLKGASPPRDNIENLVAFQRQPLTYDGSDASFWCREVSESWMTTEELETLEAFILRAAETAPGWGSENF